MINGIHHVSFKCSKGEQLKKVISTSTALVVAKGLDDLSRKIRLAAKHPEEYFATDPFTEQVEKDTIDVTLLEIFLGFRLED